MTVPPEFDSLLAALRADSAAERLSALQALAARADWLARAQPWLGPLALGDPDPDVRQAARDLLAAASSAARAIPWALRGEILRQLDQWQIRNRVSADLADLLRARYNFDMRPAPPSPEARRALRSQIELWQSQGLISAQQAADLHQSLEPQPAPGAAAHAAASTPGPAVPANAAASAGLPAAVGLPASAGLPAAAGEPAAAAPASAPGPALAGQPAAAARQTVIQTLFSELTIRIALYLGGFLVVSAALILAAILEVARLPILLGLTGAAGLAAGLTRKRLALPSFVLFAIFAALLPIDGRIYVDLFFPPGQATTGFWALVWLLTALALAGGTRLYASRLYSLLALAALEGSAFMYAIWRGDQWERFAFLSVLAALTGLAGALLLRRWQAGDQPRVDPRPLFWAAQLLAAAALGITLLVDFVNSFEGAATGADWSLQALAWLAGAAFYLLSDLAFLSFAVFPFLAAGALLCFAPALFAAFPGLAGRALTAALAVTGLLYTAAADFLHLRFGTRGRFGRYTIPTFLTALALLGWAALSGLDQEVAAGLAVFAVTALVYAGLHAQKRRPLLWLVALLSGLAAYLACFELPQAKDWPIDGAYQILAAGLVLALPDLLRGPAYPAGRAWTALARWVGAALLALDVLVTWLRLFSGPDAWPGYAQPWRIGALVCGLSALVCLGYALRFRRSGLGWGFTGLAALAYLCLLQQMAAPYRALPVLALALAFWAVGLALRGRSAGWSGLLRGSGLALASLLVFQLPFERGAGAGLALLAGGALALAELRLAGWGGLEFLAEGLLAGGVVRLVSLLNWGLPQPGTGLFAAALVVLSLDLVLTVWGYRFSPHSQTADTATNEAGDTGSAEAPDEPVPAPHRSPAAHSLAWLRFGPTAWLARGAARILGGALAALAVLALVLGSLNHFQSGQLETGWAAAIFLLLAAFLLFAAVRVYRQPLLGYAPAGLLALALFYDLRWGAQIQWLAPEVALGAFYYLAAYLLRAREKAVLPGQPPIGWVSVLRFSGLALALLAAVAGWVDMDRQGKLFASLPVAAAATLYALEAFRRRNVWLGFPASGLYLLAYFVLLIQLKVDQPQYYSVGVAVLGLLMHFLLVRTGNPLAAFLTGMVSQFVLLGTTYIQMYATHQLTYFVMLFFEGLLVLAYGIGIRSRSLVFTPLGFIVIGVITVVLSVLSGVPTAIIIGCTGVALLTGGILAVLMRERLVAASDKLGERLGGWKA